MSSNVSLLSHENIYENKHHNNYDIATKTTTTQQQQTNNNTQKLYIFTVMDTHTHTHTHPHTHTHTATKIQKVLNENYFSKSFLDCSDQIQSLNVPLSMRTIGRPFNYKRKK